MNIHPKYDIEKYIEINAFVSCFEQTTEPDFFFSGEMHNFWEMVYIKKGEIGFTSDEKVFSAEEGRIVFHKPMEFHRLWGCRNKKATTRIMSFYATGKGMKNFENAILSLNTDQEEMLDKIFSLKEENGLFEGKSVNPYARQLLKIHTELFLLNLSDTKNEQINQKSITYENYRLIINTLKENVCCNMTVSEIAKLCNLSESNLKKTFKMYSGEGVISYFNRLKIIEAKKLIKENYSLKEISDMLSFPSQNYFTVFFKRQTGILPSKYLKNI